jgi:hypothetical protein
MPYWPLAIGLTLTIAGWQMPRIISRAPFRFSARLLIDMIPALLGFLIAAFLTSRPIFAGTLVLALMIGFAFTDWVKRATLLEPVVFSDIAELIELFRHPELYLPFAGPARVILAALAILGLFIIEFCLERPVDAWSSWSAFLIPAAIILIGWALHGPFLHRTTILFRRLGPTGNPFEDAAAIGPSAMQFTYSFIARDERPTRQAEARKSAPAILRSRSAVATPIVVVQSESFFDPRRLHRSIAKDILPNFDRCRRSGLQSGRLAVTGWGANTMRTEFAVLTGLSEDAIGYDRFNPYFAFARTPLPSLASRMRDNGYRTICVHPFDRTFYRRDHVMPYLGFDAFIGEEAFTGAARSGGYVTDDEVGKIVLDLLRDDGAQTFIFAITMENHGPWNQITGPQSSPDFMADMPPIPESAALSRFIGGIRNADAMLGSITKALASRGSPGLCAFYGDHLPSFPEAFPALGFNETSSDYLIWHTNGGAGLKCDLAAHELSSAIATALDG